MNIRMKQLVAGVLGSLSMVAAGVALIGEANAKEIKLAMQTNPGTAQHDGGLKFAELVKQKSNGSLTVKIFAGGVLGGDLPVVSSLQGGTVEMSLMNASLLNGLAKEFSVLDFPFLFNNEKEAYAVMDGSIGEKLKAMLPAKGIVGLAYPELGFRHISNSKRPVKTLADLEGLKIRVIQTPVYVDMMNALGANATPLPFPEVYNALEQKAVDGATNPLVTIPVMKFDEVQKYLTLTRHQYNPQILIVSKKHWDKFTPAEQKALQDAANEARDYERKVSQEKNAQALETIKKRLEVSELSAQDAALMREKVKPVIAKYTKEIGEPFVKEVYAEVAKVRGKK